MPTACPTSLGPIALDRSGATCSFDCVTLHTTQFGHGTRRMVPLELTFQLVEPETKWKVIYKITYPNQKIYVGKDLTEHAHLLWQR